MAKARHTKKKLTKADLKEDEVMEGIAHSISWIKTNNTKAIIYGVIILGIFLAFLISRKISNKNILRNADNLTIGTYYFNQGDYNVSLHKFTAIYDKNKRKYVGAFALYYAASSLYHLGKYDEALAEYNKFLAKYSKKVPDATPLAKLAIANIYVDKKEFKEAKTKLDDMAKEYKNSFLFPEILYNKALILVAQGKNKQAKSILFDLRKKYSKTAYAKYSDDLIEQINKELPGIK